MMQGQPQGMMGAPGAGKPKMITLILAGVGYFTGVFGIHRFYTGHIGIGLAQFFTAGGCGIWQLIDIISILNGKYTDKDGKTLTP